MTNYNRECRKCRMYWTECRCPSAPVKGAETRAKTKAAWTREHEKLADAEKREASMLDLLNTELRENGPIGGQQAKMGEDARPLIQLLVDLVRKSERFQHKDAEKKAAQMREALAWYEEAAGKLAQKLESFKRGDSLDYVMAILTEMTLGGLKRARAALAITKKTTS